MSTPPANGKSTSPRRRLYWFGVITGICLAVTFTPCLAAWYFFELLPRHYARQNRVPFTAERWKAADSSERYVLSWDLIHGGVLNGKTSKDVRGFLGEPSLKDTVQKGKLPMYDSDATPGTTVWYYHLEAEKYRSQMGPSGAVLVIRFENDQVVLVHKVIE